MSAVDAAVARQLLLQINWRTLPVTDVMDLARSWAIVDWAEGQERNLSVDHAAKINDLAMRLLGIELEQEIDDAESGDTTEL